MESLLTLSIGEYSSVEIALRLTVILMTMTAVLLAFTASCVVPQLRFPLFLAAVALGGAAWFESGVWQSWKEAFELAGTSYAVSGHLIADEDRIIAWSLGVPAILFCFILVQPRGKRRALIGLAFLFMALLAPISSVLAIILLLLVGILRQRMSLASRGAILAEVCVFIGLAVSVFHETFHSISLGGGPSGELVRGEILRSGIDILSLVAPALLLLIRVLRVSNDQKSTSS